MKVYFLWFIFLAYIFPGYSNEWKTLFDGSTLEGWTEKNKEGSFEVKEGVIIGTMVLEKGTTFLCTNQEYRNFELELEIKFLNEELNSGVQFRSRCKEAKGKQKYGSVYGPQVELSAKGTQTRSGLIYGQGWKGWITPKESPAHSFIQKTGWNKVRVIAIGKEVKTWINGQFIQKTEIPDERHKTNETGFIALQCHGINSGGPYQVAWKNIRLKEIQ